MSAFGFGACALGSQPSAPSRSGTSGARGAVPGREATRGNRAAALQAGGGERRGHEGEPGKRQLSRPGGAPVPEDSGSSGLGPGGAGEPGPPPRTVSWAHPARTVAAPSGKGCPNR